MTFAAARERAADIGGGLLSGANNNLAIEYITAAKTVGDCCEENSVGIDLFYEENGVKTVFKAK